ncbi:MAG: MBL fold metallo-hydrolase [Ardenticatenaceae bacterium]|nr:MBL fold metallo-hydrolase [Ardenticatenaceae bacterium]
MLLKYFYDAKIAHASYLVGCQATGEAVIIDPGRDIEPYLHTAELNDMRIVGAAETHIHADFVSGARELAERTGATLYVSDEGDKNWKYLYLDGYSHQLLRDGDQFYVGKLRLDVMHTPGHTPEHISFILTDVGGGADRPMGIFTGDFVFVGAIGRPDLLEKAAGVMGTAVPGARAMFHSVQRFKQLPDYLQVWPAHGAGSACGKGLGAIPSSTVGYEKLFNPALAYTEEEAFVDYLLADQPEPPVYFAVMKRVNKEGPAVLNRLPTPEHLPASRLPELLEKGAMVVDTRPSGSFAAQHMPGTINIPAQQLSAWAGWFVDYERPLYLIIDGPQVAEAVRDLTYIGIDQTVGYFETAVVETLAQMGQPMNCYETAVPAKVAHRILNKELVVLDVRNQTEWDEGHIPGAQHIMLGYLRQRAHEVINGLPIVVNCETGGRSALAASILAAQGAKEVINLQGGIRDWMLAGLPVACDR